MDIEQLHQITEEDKLANKVLYKYSSEDPLLEYVKRHVNKYSDRWDLWDNDRGGDIPNGGILAMKVQHVSFPLKWVPGNTPQPTEPVEPHTTVKEQGDHLIRWAEHLQYESKYKNFPLYFRLSGVCNVFVLTKSIYTEQVKHLQY